MQLIAECDWAKSAPYRYPSDAVFWARLDRDEEGRHNVDVFYAPRYTKHTKSKGAERWISLTKFDKEKALERYAQVPKLDVRKNANGRKTVAPAIDQEGHQVMIPGTSLFWRGKALQTDFYEYLRDKAKIRGVQRGEEKHTHGKDWQSVEDYKASKDLEKVTHQLAKQKPIAERQEREIKAFQGSFFGFVSQAKRMDIEAAVKAERKCLHKHYAPIVAENKDQKTIIARLKADLNGKDTQIRSLNTDLQDARYTTSVLDLMLSQAIPHLHVPFVSTIWEILEAQNIGGQALEEAKRHAPYHGRFHRCPGV